MDNKELMWRQFCRLGEMIGDGLHYEEPWISKEYNNLRKILIPETDEEKNYKRKIRQEKNKSIDKQIQEKNDNCPKCKGELKQTRSGSKTVICTECNSRFKYRTKR